jgi:hypothetical protein
LSDNTRPPWEVVPKIWKTESSFWLWLRGVLRKGWSRHPIKLEYIARNRKRIKNPNPRGRVPEVWGMTCQQCGNDFVQNRIEIDHVGDEGRFTGREYIQSYVEHLFMVDFDRLESCCKPCHAIRSYAQRHNISFTEAHIEKQIIAKCKLPVKDIVDFCTKNGYNVNLLTNSTKRRAAITEILQRTQGESDE